MDFYQLVEGWLNVQYGAAFLEGLKLGSESCHCAENYTEMLMKSETVIPI